MLKSSNIIYFLLSFFSEKYFKIIDCTFKGTITISNSRLNFFFNKKNIFLYFINELELGINLLSKCKWNVIFQSNIQKVC